MRELYTKLFRKGIRYPDGPEGDWNWILYMDDDELPPTNAVKDLLKVGAPVMSGLVPRDGAPHHPPIGDFCKDGLSRNLIDFPFKETFEVDWAGAGFLMVSRDVINDIYERPFWQKVTSPYLSEDIRFSKLINAAGYKITVVPWVQIPHMEGRHVYTIQDFRKYLMSGGIFRWSEDERYYPR